MACDIQNHHSNQQPQEEQAADERHQMQTEPGTDSIIVATLPSLDACPGDNVEG
jgi:hypothetical protein